MLNIDNLPDYVDSQIKDLCDRIPLDVKRSALSNLKKGVTLEAVSFSDLDNVCDVCGDTDISLETAAGLVAGTSLWRLLRYQLNETEAKAFFSLTPDIWGWLELLNRSDALDLIKNIANGSVDVTDIEETVKGYLITSYVNGELTTELHEAVYDLNNVNVALVRDATNDFLRLKQSVISSKIDEIKHRLSMIQNWVPVPC